MFGRHSKKLRPTHASIENRRQNKYGVDDDDDDDDDDGFIPQQRNNTEAVTRDVL